VNTFSWKINSDSRSDNRKPILSFAEGSAIQSLSPTAIRDPKWMELFARGSGVSKTIFCVALCAAFLALSYSASAQPPAKLPKIGYLSGVSPAAETARREAFSRGLRELGYVEGKTILIEYRYSEGRYERLAGLAAELVRLKPDLIVTGGSPSTRAAKDVIRTIPIVMTNDPDPVANGFVASLALPAGNVTGLSTLAPELSGKRLAILQEVVPTLTRIAVFSTSTSPAYAPVKNEIQPRR